MRKEDFYTVENGRIKLNEMIKLYCNGEVVGIFNKLNNLVIDASNETRKIERLNEVALKFLEERNFRCKKEEAISYNLKGLKGIKQREELPFDYKDGLKICLVTNEEMEIYFINFYEENSLIKFNFELLYKLDNVDILKGVRK